MAGSFNRIIVVGNLTRDPEVKYVSNGMKAITTFSLAVNERRKNENDVMYLDVVAFEKMGEICNQYLKKGMSTLVEGRLSVRKYDDKEGNKRTSVQVLASTMQMLDAKKDGASGQTRDDGRTPATVAAAPTASAAPTSGALDDTSWADEIPF